MQPHSPLSDVTEPKEFWIIIPSDTQDSYRGYSTYLMQLTDIDCAAEYDGEPITSFEKLFQ